MRIHEEETCRWGSTEAASMKRDYCMLNKLMCWRYRKEHLRSEGALEASCVSSFCTSISRMQQNDAVNCHEVWFYKEQQQTALLCCFAILSGVPPGIATQVEHGNAWEKISLWAFFANCSAYSSYQRESNCMKSLLKEVQGACKHGHMGKRNYVELLCVFLPMWQCLRTSYFILRWILTN